tara:strand:+ start:226984 stop:227262 length:279 start_codon:yes stop_codon:yes gene_type:complete
MKTLLLILTILLTISCGDATDKDACLNSVREQFPNAEIYTEFGGSNMKFIVIDSTNIYMVRTNNTFNPEVSSVEIYQKQVSNLKPIKVYQNE